MLTEVIEGMQVADKERGEELRQLRAIVAAQQQQLDAGAVQWRSDPGLLAEQPAGASVEGRDEAQAAAPAQIEGRDEAHAAAPVSAARNGAPTACRRHESETGERVSAPLRNPRGLHCGKNLCGAFEAATVEAGAGRNGAAAGGDGAAAGTSRGVVVATRLEGLRSGAAATRPAGEAAASVAQKSLSFRRLLHRHGQWRAHQRWVPIGSRHLLLVRCLVPSASWCPWSSQARTGQVRRHADCRVRCGGLKQQREHPWLRLVKGQVGGGKVAGGRSR